MFRLGADREIRRNRQPRRLCLAGPHPARAGHHGRLRAAEIGKHQGTRLGTHGARTIRAAGADAAMSAGADFELAPHHDTAIYAAAFAATGRLHIPNLLRDEDARRLHAALSRHAAWEIRFIHKGARIMTPAQWEAIPAAARAQMET